MTKYEPKDYWTSRYEDFDLTSSGHRDLPVRYNAWLYRMQKEKIAKSASNCLSNFSEAKAIELGCGTGIYVNMWKKLGVKDLIGLDIAQNAIDQLRAEFPEYSFYCEDLTDKSVASRYGNKSYDFVTVIGVLVHIVDDDLFLQAVDNISKLVKQGGVVLISDYVVRAGDGIRKSHMSLRPIGRFRAAFEEAGLQEINQIPFYYFMIAPFDTPYFPGNYLLPKIYSFLNKMIHRWPNLMGRILFSIDKVVTCLINSGPSEKLFIYKKL